MKPATAERWAWLLIFGGGLVLSFGLFVLRQGAAWGWVPAVGGGLAMAGGVVLIVLRSRMKP